MIKGSNIKNYRNSDSKKLRWPRSLKTQVAVERTTSVQVRLCPPFLKYGGAHYSVSEYVQKLTENDSVQSSSSTDTVTQQQTLSQQRDSQRFICTPVSVLREYSLCWPQQVYTAVTPCWLLPTMWLFVLLSVLSLTDLKKKTWYRTH